MLTRVTAANFERPAASGKTRPAVLQCEKADGTTVDVFAKFSAGCMQKETDLAHEVIAACLAADLGLPLPVPFLIDIPDGWETNVVDQAYRQKIAQSSKVAFGSTYAGAQYSAWNIGTKVTNALRPTALAVFVFDALLSNYDRRSDNPNCFVKGDQIRIFDHEMVFSHRLMIGWLPPWRPGSLAAFEAKGAHIFRAGLKGKELSI